MTKWKTGGQGDIGMVTLFSKVLLADSAYLLNTFKKKRTGL